VVAGGEGVWREVKRAGQGEGVGQQLQRVAEVDDVDRLARVELTLEVLRLQTRCDEVPEDHAAAEDAGEEEGDDAQDEQGSGEAARPVEQAGIAAEQVAEEAAQSQQATQPEYGADGVEEQEGRVAHAVLAGDWRSHGGQAGNELGDHEGNGASAAEGVGGAADADGGFHRELAEQAEDMVPVAAADEEPGAVGDERSGQRNRQRKAEVELVLSGERAGGQEDRHCGQRDTELLDQDPGKEQQIAVHQQDLGGQSHGKRPVFACGELSRGFAWSWSGSRTVSCYGMIGRRFGFKEKERRRAACEKRVFLAQNWAKRGPFSIENRVFWGAFSTDEPMGEFCNSMMIGSLCGSW